FASAGATGCWSTTLRRRRSLATSPAFAQLPGAERQWPRYKLLPGMRVETQASHDPGRTSNVQRPTCHVQPGFQSAALPTCDAPVAVSNASRTVRASTAGVNGL